jgi:hypothetical protein
VNPKRRRNRLVNELKGSRTSLEVKEYFFNQVSGIRFALYSVTLNKQKVYPELQKEKEVVYNYVSRLVLDEIPFQHADTRVNFTLDRRKPSQETKDFSHYVKQQLKNRLSPKVPLEIAHRSSEQSKGLQAVDMFCYGIFQKYEWQKRDWWDIFKGKVAKDTLYFK